MWYDPNLYSLANIVAMAVVAALALVVVRSKPQTLEKRRLAGLLAMGFILCGSAALAYGAKDRTLAQAMYSLLYAAWFGLIVAWLRFLATFPSPVARWFRNSAVDGLLLTLMILGPLVWLFFVKDITFTGLGPFLPYVPWRPTYTTAGFDRFAYAQIGVTFLSILVVVDSWRRAAKGPTRSRLAIYAFSMVSFDIWNGTNALVRTNIVHTVAQGQIPAEWKIKLFLLSNALNFIFLTLLMGYAILKSNMFDVDLKLKWTLRRGTLVGIFVAAFFVATAIAEQWLQQYGVVFGGAAVGLMLFAARPLERGVNRLADKAMPNVQDTPEYASYRKMEVYKAAVEELAIGGITAKERRALVALSTKLGLGAADTRALERSLGATTAVPV